MHVRHEALQLVFGVELNGLLPDLLLGLCGLESLGLDLATGG